MTRIRLGRSDLEISRVVLGSMGHRATSLNERARLLDASLDAGITSIDTAPLYGFGEVERELGGLLAKRRNRVELLSKVGLRWDDAHGEILFSHRDAAGVERKVRRDSRPDAIRRDVEESLARLRTDVIDLCQIHQPDRSVPIADSLGALEDLAREGKIRHVGVSNFTGPEIEAAHAALEHLPLTSDQLEYNLLKRTAEREILTLASKLDFGLLAYSPLDAGSLAGRLLENSETVSDGRRRRATFQGANAATINQALRQCVEPIARDHRASIAQVCLAWILHRPGFSAVVVGASEETQAIANAGAGQLSLAPEEITRLAEGFERLSLRAAKGESIARRARRFLGRLRRLYSN